MRSAATAAMSSEIRNGSAEVSLYGSKTSAYSSTADSRPARPVRSASRSGSAPTSGSQLPGRMMSLLAPSCAPASRIWATSSSSSGTVSSLPSPAASAVTPSRKFWACCAIRSAVGRQSSACCAADPALDIEQPPSFKRPAEGHLVRVLELTAHGQAAGGPGHPEPHRLDQPGQVGGGRLALEVGVGGQDQLGNRAVGQPGHQLGNTQVIRPDSVDRADRAAEDMVAAPELTDLLNRRDVLG